MKHSIMYLAVLSGLFHAATDQVNPSAPAAAPQPSAPAPDGAAAVAALAEKKKDMKPELPVSPIPGTAMAWQKFFFKKDDLGNKRDTVELAVPFPTDERIRAMMDNDKERAIIIDMVKDLVRSHARDQVGDEKNPVNKQDDLLLDKLSLEFIRDIPPSERRGGGIAKETWETFFSDYVEIMQPITGKAKENVENAAKLFVARLQPVKTQKKILGFLEQQLALWFTSSQQQEELGEVYEFLSEKIKTLMAADEAALLANL